MLRGFLSYDLKWKDSRKVEGTFMSITGLDAWVATEVHFLVEMEKRELHHQKAYANIYRRILDAVSKKLIENVR